MKIGGKYKLLAIGAPEWEKTAAELRIDFAALHDRILYFARALPDTACKVAVEIQAQGITHDVIGRLVDALAVRAVHCEKAMSQ